MSQHRATRLLLTITTCRGSYHYQAVLHAYRTVQLRSTESKSFDHCTFGTFAPLDSPRQSIPIFLDTYSADHNA